MMTGHNQQALLPERAGQPRVMTIAGQASDAGHWYSPTAVREMIARLRAALQEADTLMGHDDNATEWRERWAACWYQGDNSELQAPMLCAFDVRSKCQRGYDNCAFDSAAKVCECEKIDIEAAGENGTAGVSVRA